MKVMTCALRGRSDGEWHTFAHYQRLEVGGHISNAVSTVLKDFLILIKQLKKLMTVMN